MSSTIRFNGEECIVEANTISELLDKANLKDKKVAVELNKEIIPKALHCSTKLNDGDVIEIVHFVGGG
jgi:sulfur carrier protein